MADQAEKLRELSRNLYVAEENYIQDVKKSPAHVIAVTSGKGGVGKSSFTVNLALTLANYGKRVLIIDADLGMANIDVIMGCISNYSLLDIITGAHSLEEVIVTGPRNVKFLPGGSGIKALAELSKLELQRVINQIIQYENDTDFIIFDTGAGMGSNVMSFVMAADDVFLVTTPEPTSLTDAYAVVKAYANNNGAAPLRLIVNRAGSVKESNIVADKMRRVTERFLDIELEPIGYILEDQAVARSIRSQNPFVLQFPDSQASKCVDYIAYKLLFGSVKVEKTGISGFFKRFFK